MARGEKLRLAGAGMLPVIEAAACMDALRVKDERSAALHAINSAALQDLASRISRELERGSDCDLVRLGVAIADAKTLVRKIFEDLG